MIGFHEFDLMARGGSLALLALWSWVLWRDHRKAFAARIALAMNAAIVAHVVASIPAVRWQHSLFYVLLDFGSSSVFGMFWLFVRAWFEDVQGFSWRDWTIALAPSLGLAILAAFGIEHHPAVERIWFPLLRLAWFALGHIPINRIPIERIF